ncbi:hypothetical protein ACIBIZ_14755 [Nonomuraea spiralis]|uniref:hypothetical protein n=1 Tax=Nonomuraea spiralis TaxID=46182 RepID=UPI0037BAC85D
MVRDGVAAPLAASAARTWHRGARVLLLLLLLLLLLPAMARPLTRPTGRSRSRRDVTRRRRVVISRCSAA